MRVHEAPARLRNCSGANPNWPEAGQCGNRDDAAMNSDTPATHPQRHDTGICAVTWSVWGRQRLLTRPETAESVMFGIHELERRGHYRAHAFVVMPDQVHLLLTLNGTLSLYHAIVATKGFATRQMRMRGAINFNKVWHKGYYEHRPWSGNDLRAQARHLVSHPLRAGLVERIVDYPWWFAEWAAPPFGRDGLPPEVRAPTPPPSAPLVENVADGVVSPPIAADACPETP